jgi:hypothetical protein
MFALFREVGEPPFARFLFDQRDQMLLSILSVFALSTSALPTQDATKSNNMLSTTLPKKSDCQAILDKLYDQQKYELTESLEFVLHKSVENHKEICAVIETCRAERVWLKHN